MKRDKRGQIRKFSLCNFFPKNRKGQVTIFIIIAVIIVAGIAAFLILRGGVIPQIGGHPEKNPSSFLQSCIEDKIGETTKLISSQGGYASNPLNKTFKFTDEKSPVDISYLCYTGSYSIPCINQEPMLIQHLKKEIKDYISDDIKNCFDKLISSLNQQGYTVDSKYNGFNVELTERRIKIPIDGKITLTKTGQTSNYENLNAIFQSRFYDTALVVLEIVNAEATKGEFNNYDTFSYPEFDINKHMTADSSIIYEVKDRNSDEKFNFAVRGAVTPPGFGLKK